jgi:glucokinase
MRNQAVLGVDIGGTGIKCALVTSSKQVLHTERHPTGAERGPAAVISTVLAVAARLAGRAQASGLDPVAAGIVMPGIVDERAGIARYAANLGIYRDMPLRQLVEERLALPVHLGHDVRASGLAEAVLGAGQGREHLLVVTIGTGIGTAHLAHRRLLAGAHGAAGEIGHVIVRPDGPTCGCGQRGCLEAVASAAAVGRRYSELGGSPAAARDVALRAAAGEDLAGQVWTEAVEALATGLLAAQALLDVELIVLGGGLAEAGDQLLTPLRAALRGKITFHREPELVRARLGDQAGCLGSALLALDLIGAPQSRVAS